MFVCLYPEVRVIIGGMVSVNDNIPRTDLDHLRPESCYGERDRISLKGILFFFKPIYFYLLIMEQRGIARWIKDRKILLSYWRFIYS